MIIPGMRDVEAADLEAMGAILPEGTYLATCTDAEEGMSNNNPFVQFKFKVVQPQAFAGKNLRDRVYFTEAAMPIAKAKLEAIGYDTQSDRQFNPADVVNRGVMLTVVHDSVLKDGLPRIYANITVWKKAGAGGAPQAGQPAMMNTPAVPTDDDIPF